MYVVAVCALAVSVIAHGVYDAHGMKKIIASFPDQIEQGIKIGATCPISREYKNIHNVVACGMGGSAITADIIGLVTKDELSVPYTVVKNYVIPRWVNQNSLVLLFSYSGNTEETRSCFAHAHQQGAQIIGISSGGVLTELLQQHGYDCVTIPGGLPPRAALGYLLTPILCVLSRIGCIPDKLDSLHSAIKQLKDDCTVYATEGDSNLAYMFATMLHQSIPYIYGEAITTAVLAYRWCCQLAENSKMLAHSHILPELNHNEIVGWQRSACEDAPIGVVWLLDDMMHERNAKRYQLMHDIIDAKAAYQLSVFGKGETFLERVLFLIYLGDWVSYWCSQLNHVDPTPICNIDHLKEAMK